MADVFSRLKEREQARLAALEKQKLEKEGERRVEETSEHFLREFEQKRLGNHDTLPAAAVVS